MGKGGVKAPTRMWLVNKQPAVTRRERHAGVGKLWGTEGQYRNGVNVVTTM